MGNSVYSKLFVPVEYMESKYNSIDEVPVMDINRNEISLKEIVSDPTTFKYYMIVNVASQNLKTKIQMEELKANELNQKEKGIQVVLVPSNTFNNEPQGFDYIKETYQNKFTLNYPILSKLEVNGAFIHPLYKFQKKNSSKCDSNLSCGIPLSGDFTKFLVDPSMNKITCQEPSTKIDEFLSKLD